MAELKPCPFCKLDYTNTYEFQNYYSQPYRWRVICNSCGAEGPIKDTEQQAIDAWNKRS